MNEQPKTPEQVSMQSDDSTQEDTETDKVPKPSVKIQNMNHLYYYFLHL